VRDQFATDQIQFAPVAWKQARARAPEQLRLGEFEMINRCVAVSGAAGVAKLSRLYGVRPGSRTVEADELTGSAGLSKDESHDQAAFP